MCECRSKYAVLEFKVELAATSVTGSYNNNAKIHHNTRSINLNLVYTYHLAEQYSREKNYRITQGSLHVQNI